MIRHAVILLYLVRLCVIVIFSAVLNIRASVLRVFKTHCGYCNQPCINRRSPHPRTWSINLCHLYTHKHEAHPHKVVSGIADIFRNGLTLKYLVKISDLIWNVY